MYPFSVLSRCGIKHPKPIPFLGNLLMFRQTLRFATKPMTDCLLMLRDEQWKRVRSILTPSFSSAKLKEMVPLINTATDALMRNLNVAAESGEAFDIHKPIVLFFMAFPFITAPLARLVPNKRRDTMNQFFINSIQKIMKQREEQPAEQRRRDFLQLMLDARTSKEGVSLEHFDAANPAGDPQSEPSASDPVDRLPPQEPSSRRPKKKMITEDEIVGQAFVFLLAGYETSSSALAFTCYLLAIHPECQSKVQQEVDEFYTKHESPDYTNVQELKYLDMVLSETLRLYPPGFRFGRDIDQDCLLNGQFLPRGATLEVPVGFLHYDPEYWPEPERFLPER
ncbi:Thromboxane-A synthase [Liparis tanakae]|uniref:Thromboxane-A synthase n=1 Tax=Liparis tanakae TaxID=230148 RepID=A0A4Z2FKD7_9TELE|nr:Thromboxane-A synthase [Liparis tanakae]